MSSTRLARLWNPISRQRHAETTRALVQSRFFTQSTCLRVEYSVNAPLELDQSMRDLLRDADIAIQKFKHKSIMSVTTPRELEVIASSEGLDSIEQYEMEEAQQLPELKRSPEAQFGSQRIGAVVLPPVLVNAIEKVIEGRDKHTLHNDAVRIFNVKNSDVSDSWHTDFSTHYKSRKQASRHADRDATAFASVALPAHFSAVLSVLEHVKHRLEKPWEVKNIVDWGSAVGSGLWASLHTLQKNDAEQESKLSFSTVESYLAIDDRVGLTAMAKQLLDGVDIGQAKVRWQKGFSDASDLACPEGGSLALSAFYLSTLPTPLARKAIVKEMWQSGAEVIVLIDHDSRTGCESILEAREYLLRMGRKDTEDPSIPNGQHTGCHVVAPCPHDGICPLYHNSSASSVKCSFSQRIQTPTFLRKTKHAMVGHEDVGYTYVVIRRGSRPSLAVEASNSTSMPVTPSIHSHTDQRDIADETKPMSHTHLDLAEQIRMKSFNWPRLVFPPLKRSGHVILDCCTPKGKIMRMTIPRSQGKQEYYDARKSSWGDIFPHPPKNPPQVRLQSMDGKTVISGNDIGKRQEKKSRSSSPSYKELIKDVRSTKRRRHQQERDLHTL